VDRLLRLASTSSSKSVLVAYVATPHESSTDETVVAVVERVAVLEVKAVVAVEDDVDDACGVLVLLPPPCPRTQDARDEYSALSTLGGRQLHPTSTATGGCRGSRKPSPLRRLEPPPPPRAPESNCMAIADRGLVARTTKMSE
jgi:hypothetical protein